jgi:hypothetical protein
MPRSAWPGKERSVEAIRSDPSALAGLGIGEIVGHHDRIVRGLDKPPSSSATRSAGCFVQLLVERGLGAAGIAIDSAPPKGVFAPRAHVARVTGPDPAHPIRMAEGRSVELPRISLRLRSHHRPQKTETARAGSTLL